MASRPIAIEREPFRPAHAGSRPELQVVRASGLAQARLQVAVLSGNRRRALEQIDRLVAIDKLIERMSAGGLDADLAALEAELADQRLALASEKLVLTSDIVMPRLEPAFGAGFGQAIAPEEPVEIVEADTIDRRLRAVLLGGLALFLLFAGLAVAALWQI